jgi:tRNA1Val (adenine37-N6)-methyltransferase
MKVCTDACLLGSMAHHPDPKRILDIGAGTGLLSLMLAQRFDCPIDAVEVYPPAYEDAVYNFSQSKWHKRIAVHLSRIQNFNTTSKYDLIVSNPPFFSNYKKSIDLERNIALHNDSLPLSDLVKTVNRLLSAEGVFYVLLPSYETNNLIKMMSLARFHVINRCIIRNFPHTGIFREVTAFSNSESSCEIHELIIKSDEGIYTSEFIQLLKPYYLYL